MHKISCKLQHTRRGLLPQEGGVNAHWLGLDRVIAKKKVSGHIFCLAKRSSNPCASVQVLLLLGNLPAGAACFWSDRLEITRVEAVQDRRKNWSVALQGV